MDSSFAAWRKLIVGSDIRGCETKLTDEFAEKIGYVFAQWTARSFGLTSDQICLAVGHDPRASGERLKRALIAGMRAADCDVLDCGMCATSALALACVEKPNGGRFARAHGAISVTAGHRPADWNGFKFITREGGISEADAEALVAAAATAELPDPLVTEVDLQSEYADSLRSMVRRRLSDAGAKPLLGLHVIVDAGSGAGGFYAELLRGLGANTDGSRFLEPDGAFPNGVPDTEDERALEYIAKEVPARGADLGVLIDADGDRAAIVDQSGMRINGSRLIALTASILLEECPGATFVTDSVTSSGLQQFINEWGGEHYRFKCGYRNVIGEAIRLNDEGVDCPLAIVTNGHAAFRENHFLDDGMYLATRLICEAMRLKREGLTLSSRIADLHEPVERVQLRLPVLDEENVRSAAQDVIEAVLSHTLDDPEWVLAPDNREGVRITFNLDGGVCNAWFQLRISMRDPVIPLDAESDVPGGVKRILTELYQLIRSADTLDLSALREIIQ